MPLVAPPTEKQLIAAPPFATEAETRASSPAPAPSPAGKTRASTAAATSSRRKNQDPAPSEEPVAPSPVKSTAKPKKRPAPPSLVEEDSEGDTSVRPFSLIPSSALTPVL